MKRKENVGRIIGIKELFRYLVKYSWIIVLCVVFMLAILVISRKNATQKTIMPIEHSITVQVVSVDNRDKTTQEKYYERQLWSDLLVQSMEMLYMKETAEYINEQLRLQKFEVLDSSIDKVTYTPIVEGGLITKLKLSGIDEKRCLYILESYVKVVENYLQDEDVCATIKILEKTQIAEKTREGVMFSKRDFAMTIASLLFGVVLVFMLIFSDQTILNEQELFMMYEIERVFSEKQLLESKQEFVIKKSEDFSEIPDGEDIVIEIELGKTKRRHINLLLEQSRSYKKRILGCVIK